MPPTFAEVAGHLVDLLRGRVLVAHNARFDVDFLTAELERTGYDGVTGVQALCTMLLAREFLPGAGRSLADCCDACGIRTEEGHRAIADAVAAAELLGIFIDSGDRGAWDRAIDDALDAVWPPFPSTAPLDAVWRPRGAISSAPPKEFLARLRDQMPELAGPDDHQVFLALLDRCLLDRHLSEHETRELVHTADELGIGRETAARLHREYFDSLVGVAWQDGVLTTEEIADLAQVAKVLSLPAEAVAAALTTPPAPIASNVVVPIAHTRLAPGRTSCSRARWSDRASTGTCSSSRAVMCRSPLSRSVSRSSPPRPRFPVRKGPQGARVRHSGRRRAVADRAPRGLSSSAQTPKPARSTFQW